MVQQSLAYPKPATDRWVSYHICSAGYSSTYVLTNQLRSVACWSWYDCSWCLELSADGPETAGFVTESFQTVAEDVFICSVGPKRSVNHLPPFNCIWEIFSHSLDLHFLSITVVPQMLSYIIYTLDKQWFRNLLSSSVAIHSIRLCSFYLHIDSIVSTCHVAGLSLIRLAKLLSLAHTAI